MSDASNANGNADPVNDLTVELIKRFEGCRLDAYQDSVGVWTIGYGHTGHDVGEGMKISQARADELLRMDLHRFEQCVDDALEADATDNQYGAMVSLAFNIGCSGFQHSSVLRDHNAGNTPGAADAFLMWVKAGGRVLSGLVRRRHAERLLYLRPDDPV